MEFKVRNHNPIIAAAMKLNQGAGRRGFSYLGGSLLAGALLVAGSAQAQTTSPTAAPAPADESLTWHGITLYGIVDMDFQYETPRRAVQQLLHLGRLGHRAEEQQQSASPDSRSNGLSQSRVGLAGQRTAALPGLVGVFKLESYFNPGVRPDHRRPQIGHSEQRPRARCAKHEYRFEHRRAAVRTGVRRLSALPPGERSPSDGRTRRSRT